MSFIILITIFSTAKATDADSEATRLAEVNGQKPDGQNSKGHLSLVGKKKTIDSSIKSGSAGVKQQMKLASSNARRFSMDVGADLRRNKGKHDGGVQKPSGRASFNYGQLRNIEKDADLEEQGHVSVHGSGSRGHGFRQRYSLDETGRQKNKSIEDRKKLQRKSFTDMNCTYDILESTSMSGSAANMSGREAHEGEPLAINEEEYGIIESSVTHEVALDYETKSSTSIIPDDGAGRKESVAPSRDSVRATNG